MGILESVKLLSKFWKLRKIKKRSEAISEAFPPEQKQPNNKQPNNNQSTNKQPEWKPQPFDVVKNAETGQLSGIISPSGEFYFAKPKEITTLAGKWQAKRAMPFGTRDVAAELQGQRARYEAFQQAAELQKLIGQLPPEQQQIAAKQLLGGNIGAAPIDWGQALGVATTSLLPRLVQGGAGGLLLSGGNPLAAVGAGAVYGLGSATNTFVSNLKSQRKGQMTAEAYQLTKAERNLKMLISDTMQNPQNTADNIALFNEELAAIRLAYGRLIVESHSDLNRYIIGDDGTPELAKFEIFEQHTRQILEQRMAAAVMYGQLNAKAYLTDEEINQMQMLQSELNQEVENE